ncbi:MAG: hypothetical protein JXR76_15435 [Deltaproteobacteria bacterium]|nr:hypothetical protein [Deltaproteobacteria bacterium]
MVQALSIFAAVFVVGAMLLLERRCLGKPAVVQPLVLCLIAGLLQGESTTGLWLGISLQLLSMGQSHYCNWVLAAITAGGSVAILGAYDILLVPGAPAAVALLLVSILVGIVFDFIDRKLSFSRGNSVIAGADIWKSESGEEFSRLIYRMVFRGFLFGGMQSMLGVGLASALGYAMTVLTSVQPHLFVQQIVALLVPLFGVSVTLGSLSGRVFPFYAFIGVAVSAGVGGIL